MNRVSGLYPGTLGFARDIMRTVRYGIVPTLSSDSQNLRGHLPLYSACAVQCALKGLS